MDVRETNVTVIAFRNLSDFVPQPNLLVFSDYEADRKKRLGTADDQPHRIKYWHLTRA